ncbi:helix-turn-helix transcriptional regulator [Eubacteriales bacterium OttesenSCG-928-N14]|nr:helix-turn-helix transcriptional regulator [Eubacteriales bacterium OttesenSCG-928-N14]
MDEKNFPTRLAIAMKKLGVSAQRLGKECGISNSLVSRWQHGTRPLTPRSKAVPQLARALLRLDAGGALDDLLAPYRSGGEDDETALCAFLLAPVEPGLPARARAPALEQSGDYVVQHRVLLGRRGFRKAALLMLDYLLALPPGREVVVLCQGRYDWLVGDLVFVLQFIQKLQKVVKRDTTLTVINRRGYSIAETAAFAGPWLTAHMHGHIRSLYYDGELPVGDRFIASIKGYWCGYAVEDETAEDSLYITLYTDPRDIRRGEMVCDTYRAKSDAASQYGVLQNPAGSANAPRLWQGGPLPRWPQPEAEAPTGAFYALCRTPCFGVMTRAEWAEVCGADAPPELPEYLFAEDEVFTPGPHRIILCREDVREALTKERSQSLPLSTLLGRRAFVPRQMLTTQLKRLLAAAEIREDFEIALVPRSAFAKLKLELVCWQNSASVGWLQDGSQSVFANDKATSGSFYGFLGHTWGKLQQGWKRKRHTLPLLRKWLAGKGLDVQEKDSSIVKGWDVLPKE